MTDDIKFWQGKAIKDMDADELRAALAIVYREHEQVVWLAHQQKLVIEKLTKAKKGKVPDDIDEEIEQAIDA
jgi:hypothetical protein